VKKYFKRKEKKEETPRNLAKEKEKNGITSSHTRSSDIKCFKCLGRGHIAYQCPTKKTMILRGVEKYSSQDESDSKSESEGSNGSNSEDAYPCDRDLLMVIRISNNQPSPQALTERENIFHTSCKVLENTYSLVMDNGLCCNYRNTRLVDKLASTILPI